MKPLKFLLLFLALLLPVCIFLFLKLFGKNQFDVPLLHEQAVVVPAGCSFNYAAPYRLPDSVAAHLRRGHARIFVVNFSGRHLENRLYTELTPDDVVLVGGAAIAEDMLQQDILRKCVFLLEGQSDIALVDEDQRIRGYYESSERESIDRLIVEILILLKKY